MCLFKKEQKTHLSIIFGLEVLTRRYLWPVSLLGGEGHIHHVSDGQAGHGALGEGDDLVDALHHGVQLGVGLQRELAADLKTEEEKQLWEIASFIIVFIQAQAKIISDSSLNLLAEQ